MTQKGLFPLTPSSQSKTHVAHHLQSQTIRGFSLHRVPEAVDVKDRTRQIGSCIFWSSLIR